MAETEDGQLAGATADVPLAQALQYESATGDAVGPMFRATMGVGITLGLVHVLYLPNLIWWYSEVRQVFGSNFSVRYEYEFALSIAESAAAVCILIISAMALCGRRPARGWFIALLVLVLCSTAAAQVARYELWELAVAGATSSAARTPLWTLFRVALAMSAAFAWPILMLILITRPILRPAFGRRTC